MPEEPCYIEFFQIYSLIYLILNLPMTLEFNL